MPRADLCNASDLYQK